MIRERQEARERKELDTEWRRNKSVRNSIRRDKKKYWSEQLEKGDWQEVKVTKQGFMPKFTKIRDEKGVVVPSSKRPDILADHFEKKQWGNKLTQEEKSAHAKVKEYRNNKLYPEVASTRVGPYTLEESKRALKKMKTKKAPGPDDITIEAFKAMDDESFSIVKDAINGWRLNRKLPKELAIANVVTIYKKGNVEDPGNYRPIALLQTLYKLHAAMLRNRLIDSVYDRIFKAQYGFRAKKSTTQPLFVARRLRDISEASASKLFLVILDWKKAFDEIDQEELVNAVRRLNVPEENLEELTALYAEIFFKIKDIEGESTERMQNTGIRQGCPLSPYLFIILMTALMEDVYTEVKNVETQAATDAGTATLLYADDTLNQQYCQNGK